MRTGGGERRTAFFDCSKSGRRSIVLAVERFDVFRRAILATSRARSVSWWLMAPKPASSQLPVCRIHIYDRRSSVSASLGVQKETANPLCRSEEHTSELQ